MANSAISISGGGGGSGLTDAVTQTISQITHSFAIGDIIYESGSLYKKAVASGVSESEVFGIVSAVSDANTFVVTTHGNVSSLTSLIPGSVYFLSNVFSGSYQLTPPTLPGHVVKPVLIAKTTTNALFNIYNGYIPLSQSNVVTKTSNFVVSSGVNLYLCSGSAGITASLDTASLFGNTEVNIKNLTNNFVYVTSSFSELFDGDFTLINGESLRLACNGTKYYIV